MVHELEHTRRGSDTNAHGPGEDADGRDGNNFNACAASYARHAIDAGLNEAWHRKFTEVVSWCEMYDCTGDDVRTSIRKLGKINRPLLNELFKK